MHSRLHDPIEVEAWQWQLHRELHTDVIHTFGHWSLIFQIVLQLQHRVLNDLLQKDSGEAKNKTQVSLGPRYYDNQLVLENTPCHCLTLLFINKSGFILFYS